jgi:hypothetical protein
MLSVSILNHRKTEYKTIVVIIDFEVLMKHPTNLFICLHFESE